jgi:hypothetical protein
MRLDITLDRVPVGYVFMEIITDQKTCYIYKLILLNI